MNQGFKKVVIAVGGTGGHLFPAQAFAKELKLINYDLQIIFAGSGLETNAYFNKRLFAFKEITSSTPFRKKILKSLSLIFKGYLQALGFLKKEKPQLIVGFGSYHSFPVLLAAKTLCIPYALFESNAIPGKVIKLLAKKAAFTAIQLPHAKKFLKGKVKEVNMPLWLNSFEKPESKESAKISYGLSPHLFTVLIFGGSQGASFINQIFKQASCLLKEELDFQVIHIVGKKDFPEEFSTFYQEMGIRCCVMPFEENMAKAWTAADIAVCRSGAATVAEILFFEVPSILIPYPHATDAHQLINASFLQEKSAALVMEEKNLNAQILKAEIMKIFSHLGKQYSQNLKTLKAMREHSLAHYVHDFLQNKGGI